MEVSFFFFFFFRPHGKRNVGIVGIDGFFRRYRLFADEK